MGDRRLLGALALLAALVAARLHRRRAAAPPPAAAPVADETAATPPAPRRRLDLGLLGAVAAALVTTAGAAAGLDATWILPFGLALVLLAPGYCLRRALGRRSPFPGEETTLAVASSLGLTIALGVVLQVTTAGLTRLSWALALSAVTLAAALAAALRRERPAPRRLRRPAGGVVLRLGLAVVILGATAVTAVASQDAWLGRQHFAQLSLDRQGRAVLIGVRNDEGRPHRYTATVWLDGRRQSVYRLALPDRGVWQRRITPPAGTTSLRVTLDRPGARSPYRYVVLKELRP